ncbi:MAG TPA: Crp/Fnr family transcriptional regulator [Clostridiales bacterium]|nr:Crp/Fnr family transcriptional regulator [Clostridiales bacterium]
MSQCNHTHGLCVSKVPIFSEFSNEELLKINNLVRKKEFRNGEIICHEGDPGEYLYIIESGLIKLFKIGKNGNEYILRLLKEGQFFGELVLFKDDVSHSSAEAIGDCSICIIPKNDLERLIKTSSDLSYNLLAAVTSRLNKTEIQLESLALEDAMEKTLRLLLELAKENGTKNEEGILIDLPLSRAGLASLIGVSHETLSRKLSELQEEGTLLIKGQKQLLLTNPSNV